MYNCKGIFQFFSIQNKIYTLESWIIVPHPPLILNFSKFNPQKKPLYFAFPVAAVKLCSSNKFLSRCYDAALITKSFWIYDAKFWSFWRACLFEGLTTCSLVMFDVFLLNINQWFILKRNMSAITRSMFLWCWLLECNNIYSVQH